ncbi:hypothetical protein QCA50_001809 [Cerrena zonata]|uniref:YDG domain-containing protein n=1 Tax=Cerrena zonata TaxID=2478898 RepID=A0AAW0GRU4_9APHY
MTKFDDDREANIAKNLQILDALGLGTGTALLPMRKVQRPVKKKAGRPPKRKETPSDATSKDEDEEPPRKASRIDLPDGGVRRSARNATKRVDYSGDGDNVVSARARPKMISEAARREADSEPRSSMQRVHDPKQYGAIPGIEVGTWWETREACSKDAIHAPWVAGIAPGPQGAYSVALSGGYEDDIDIGDGFTFTGSGGRDLKGTKNNPKNLRTAEQSSDQTFENNFNKALKKSAETKKPVRVIRGYKLHSQYAPLEGYRYDGLYTVEKAWQDRGLSGFLVCKFAFKRIPGQAPVPVAEEGSIEVSDQEE